MGLDWVAGARALIPQYTARRDLRPGKNDDEGAGRELQRTIVAPRAYPWHLSIVRLDLLRYTDCRKPCAVSV